MRSLTKWFFVLLVCCVMAQRVGFAEESLQAEKRISLGAGISFEYYDFLTVAGGTVDWQGGYGYSFGVIAEYELSNLFTLQSGFWYGINFIDLNMRFSQNQMSDTIEARTVYWIFPFYLILSYSIENLKLGLVGGINFMHIQRSKFYGEMGTISEIEVTEYLNYDLYGPAAGVQFQVGLSQYIQFFVQAMAEIYATKFIRTSERTADYLECFRVMSGVLFKMY